MDQFDFRGETPSPSSHALVGALGAFTANQNKQAEIDAMLARARIQEEGAGARNAATNEAQIAIHQANNDTQRIVHLIPKETVAAYNKSAGTSYPEMDMPATTFGGLITADKQAATDAARERMWAGRDATNLERTTQSNERIANTQAATQRYTADKQAATEANRLLIEQHRLELERQGQQRLDQGVAEKRRSEARENVETQIKGALNAVPNTKTGLNTMFDPGQALIDNPTEALALSQQIGAAGGLPKGAPVTPIKPYPAPGIGNLWSNTPAYQAEKATYDTNVAQWKKNIAPPSTGGGLNKSVPSELAPSPQGPQGPAPAGTQPMGELGGMVGPQPLATGPGPTAPGSPSPSPSTIGGYERGTYKGRPAEINRTTGHVKYLDGAM